MEGISWGDKMYLRQIFLGIALFLIYWFFLPLGLVLAGILLGGPKIGLETTGGILAGLGFVFGVLAASYALLDGGGVAYCCPPEKLLRCGPYSMCRHPMYTGFIVFLIGLALRFGTLGSLLVSLAFTAFVVFGTLFYEEKRLERKCPEYSSYKKEVPAFIPKFPKKDDKCPPLLFHLLFYLGHILSWFTWHIRFEKRCKIPKGGYMVISNHATYIDFAVIVYTLSRFISFPVTYVPYEKKRWFYKLVGCFPIRRHKSDMRAIMKIISLVKEGGRVGIFPEGERSWDGRFLGFKKGFDKLLEKIPKPLIGIRIEKAHLLFPRWGRWQFPGKIKAIVECFDDPKELERFLSKPSVSPDDTYPSYKGVDKYIYRCTKCGNFHTLRSFKTGFKCVACGFEMRKPSVGDLWKIHDENYEKLPQEYSETVELLDVHGKKTGKIVKALFKGEKLTIGEKVLKREDIKSFIVEGNRDIFFYDGKDLLGFRCKTALLWNDLVKKHWGVS